MTPFGFYVVTTHDDNLVTSLPTNSDHLLGNIYPEQAYEMGNLRLRDILEI